MLTFTLPYRCDACASTSGQLIDLATHHAVTKFATAPELRCPRCKGAMPCVAGEASMAALPGLGKPSPSPELVKSLGLLRERAQPAASRLSVAALPGALPPGLAGRLSMARSGRRSAADRGPYGGPFAPVLPELAPPRSGRSGAARAGARGAARGGARGRRLLRVSAAATGGGAEIEVTARSAPERPAWIVGRRAEGGARARDVPSRGSSCVGASVAAALRDDAEAEAADAAYEAAANAIALRIADPAWKRAVPPIYAAARTAKLGALDRAPDQAGARRDVREARAAVAAALRATGGAAVPAAPTGRYWEELTGPEGKRYVAYAQVALGATELARLVEAYAQPASALGATAAGAFPLVGWRHPRLERGAIVTALGPGPLQDAGLAEQAIVLSIDGRDVADAAGFARIAADEHAHLEQRGGTLRLKVQTADPAPRELAIEISPRAAAGGGGGGGSSGGSGVGGGSGRPGGSAGGSGAGPPGGVNVWDRVGGGKGSGRDDPTQ